MAALPPMDGLARSMEMLQRWPLQADAALRAWAWTNPTVAAAVRQQEAEWERLILHWLEQFVPDLTIRRIPDGNHWVLHQKPELVNQYIREFLTRATAP